MTAELRRPRPPRAFAVVLVLLSLAYLYSGVALLSVGGAFFYALTGIVLAVCGALLWKANRLGSQVYGALLAATLLWGLLEVGPNLWALLPRVLMLAVIG